MSCNRELLAQRKARRDARNAARFAPQRVALCEPMDPQWRARQDATVAELRRCRPPELIPVNDKTRWPLP